MAHASGGANEMHPLNCRGTNGRDPKFNGLNKKLDLERTMSEIGRQFQRESYREFFFLKK